MRALVRDVRSIEFSDVPGARGTQIKWLISPKDGAPTFAMRLIRIEANGEIPEHSHPWEHEIFILKGSGKIRVYETIYDVSEGDAVLIPPDAPHEYHADTEMLFICLIPNSGVPPEYR
ncbi:MAG: cupin domain-containing protein [Candidatus Korarchaeum sp.]|jgi:quercetin dioxygenase-like cupin family protein|nr:cupin domain-containing protein [Candidatus Korarchaeum sp.]